MEFPKELLLPPLPFSFTDLEPILSKETLEAHYLGHHKGYVDKYNQLIKNLKADEEDLKFNYNGHLLHTLYWNNIRPDCTKPMGKLKTKLRSQLGSNFENILVEKIRQLALRIKGSGWIVIAYDVVEDKIRIRTIPNHKLDVIGKLIPLLVIDYWEHAYYLNYKFNKKDFLTHFYSLLNWEAAEVRLISI